MSCENGYKVSILLDFYYDENGQRQIRAQRKVTECGTDPGPIVAGVFLTFILILAVLASLMAIVTISTSYTLKKLLYCHILINICCVVILDCLVNLPVAIAYVTTAPWQFGYNICYFNAFAMFCITCEMVLSILLFVLDRFFVLRKFARYLRISRGKLKALIVLTWVISISFAVSIVAGFTSMPYRKRYSCTVADPRDDIYMAVCLVFVVIIPTLLMTIICLISGLIFHRERKKQKKSKSGQTFSYLEQILMLPYYRNELYPTLCMACLVIFYLILWLPFSTLTTVHPILTADWINKTFDSSHEFEDHLIEAHELQRAENIGLLNGTDNHNITMVENSNVTNHIHYIPEVTDTGVHETVFVWFRFIFDMLIPIIIFVTLKDIRLKCGNLFLCCRPPSVDVTSPKQISPPYTNKTPKSSGFTDIRPTNRKAKNENKKMVSFKTPVLFATGEGLHIRTVEETHLDMNDQKHLLNFNKNPNNDPKFCYQVCDIVYPDEDTIDLEGQYILDEEIIPNGLNHDENMNSPRSDLTFEESVKIGANAALMSNRSEDVKNKPPSSEPDQALVSPPRSPEIEERHFSVPEDNDKDENFDETIELDDGKPNKPKKKVRFDTNLNIHITRPNSAASSASYYSDHEGSVYDDSEVEDEEQEETQRINVHSYRAKPQSNNHGSQKHKKVVHNVRNTPSLPARKQPPAVYNRFNRPDDKKRFVGPNNKVVPAGHERRANSPTRNPRRQGAAGPKLNKIKSRYMNHLKTGSPLKDPPPSRKNSTQIRA